MTEADSGMVRALREFFKNYKGCKNCIHKDEYVCEDGKIRSGKLICPAWERNDKKE